MAEAKAAARRVRLLRWICRADEVSGTAHFDPYRKSRSLRFDAELHDNRPPLLGIGFHKVQSAFECQSFTRESLVPRFASRDRTTGSANACGRRSERIQR